MRRIRVLQLVTGLAAGEQVGGAELFGIQLARHLDKSVFDLAVFGLWQYGSSREKEWLAYLEREGIQAGLLAVPTGRIVDDLRRAWSNFWSAVSAFEPDIINSHSERGDVFNLSAHLLHPARPCAVRTMGTDQQWQNRPWAGAVLLNVVFPFAFDAEVANSEATRQVLDARPLARLKRKKAFLCYNGIDADILQRRVAQSSSSGLPPGVPDRHPRVGVVGRLTQQKGYADLLAAIKRVQQMRPVELLIVGSGPLEADLRHQAEELGIRECVHFLGSRSDYAEIMACLDLMVSSSLWEGLPTVLLEAMALGVPVVATDVSGSRELVKTGVTGRLVPPHDPDHLAEAILETLDHLSLAQAMAENARQVAAQFTIQNAAAGYAQIYQQLVHNEFHAKLPRMSGVVG